jgi:hypothetical protein
MDPTKHKDPGPNYVSYDWDEGWFYRGGDPVVPRKSSWVRKVFGL